MNSSNDSLAMQPITRLVDENSFIEIGSLVTARSTDFNLAATDTPSDGVITGHGLIDGHQQLPAYQHRNERRDGDVYSVPEGISERGIADARPAV